MEGVNPDTAFSVPVEALWLLAAMPVLGIWLGWRSTITVYRNLTDVGLTFGTVLFPFAVFIIDDVRWVMAILTISVGLIILVAVRTWKDNRSLWKWAFAFATKFPLALLFIFAGLSALTTKRVEADSQSDTQVAGPSRAVVFAVMLSLGLLIFRLMRDRPGRFEGQAKL